MCKNGETETEATRIIYDRTESKAPTNLIKR